MAWAGWAAPPGIHVMPRARPTASLHPWCTITGCVHSVLLRSFLAAIIARAAFSHWIATTDVAVEGLAYCHRDPAEQDFRALSENYLVQY